MVTVASATRQASASDFFANTWLGKSLSRLKSGPEQVKVVLAYNESGGLPEFYNRVIEENQDSETITLAHDDLCIADLWFFDKIRMATDEFDIAGICGTRVPPEEAFSAWNISPPDQSGQIGNAHKPSDETVFSANMGSFGPCPAKASELDGVLIAFRPEKIGDLRFDERFRYHHYDVDFTLSADKRGLKVGTWPIFAVHVSTQGDGYNSRSWRESSDEFTEKWQGRKIGGPKA